DPKRLPKDIREALSKESAAKRRIYPKDFPKDVREELFARYWVGLEPLRKSGKLGAILLQYPDWFVISKANKEEILHARELLPDDRLAVEFRNATWMSERNRAETLSFLGEHGLIYVSVDEPQGFPSSIPPVAAVTNDALAIVRFHGRNAENWKKPGPTRASSGWPWRGTSSWSWGRSALLAVSANRSRRSSLWRRLFRRHSRYSLT